MMVKTKLQIPRVQRTLVSRPRLMAMLTLGMRAKLTLVSAQAGYGKTTVLSEWARQCDNDVAWISLDKQDNDWIQFWSYVIASVREKMPGFGVQAELRVEKGPSVSYSSNEPLIQELLNELTALSRELAIVIDDYHFIDMAQIHQSLFYLVEHLPPHIHLYIASRTEPKLPIARLRANGELQQITMQDLRFELEEGLGFFEGMTDFMLTNNQATELMRQTEGWVSGLQLAAISLKRSVNISDSIHRFGGMQEHLMDYFLEEVFKDLAEPLQTFLLETSILTRMNRFLCEAVTGQPNSQELLGELEQLNLFLIRLDDERNWYRYHQLLADFLQHTLSTRHPDKKLQAHIRAGHWLEQHGFVEEAAEHYMEGHQFDDLVRVIEDNLTVLLHKKMATISKWVLQVPEGFLTNRPMVEMFYLLLLIGIGKWELAAPKIETAKIRYQSLQGHIDEAEWKEIMGNISFLCATISYFQRDLERISDYFLMVERFTPNGCLFQNIGHNKYNSGFEEFEDHLTLVNDYQAAASFLSQWITRCTNIDSHPFAGRFCASYGKLLYEWNRLTEAEACIAKVLEPRMTPNTRSLVQIYFVASRIQQAMGNRASALELLEQLKMQIDSPDYERFLRKIEAEQASLAVRQGNVKYAHDWLERCGLRPTDTVLPSDVAEYVTLVRVLVACGRTEDALVLSERLYRLFSKDNRLRDRITILILQSVTLQNLAKTEEALDRLELALCLAEPQGFVRSFSDEGTVMAELLSTFRQQSNRHANRRMVISPEYLEKLVQETSAEQKGTSNGSIRVQCFGRFRLFAPAPAGRGEQKREEIKWRTSKAEELMAYLVHHRGEAVHRHHILENIWGDWNLDKAAAQLNLTAHYIRKALRSQGIEGIIHHARGFYHVDVDRLDCDFAAFEQRVTEIYDVNDDNIDECEQLADMYTGRYLANNGYEWSEQTGSHLEHDYIALLMQIQYYYVSRRNFRLAVKTLTKVLACTPWKEDVHVRLIEVYLSSGDRGAAMKQYDHLRNMLKIEYDSEPGEVVKRLLGIF